MRDPSNAPDKGSPTHRDQTYWQYPLWGAAVGFAITTVDRMLMDLADLAAEERCHASCAVAGSLAHYRAALAIAIPIYIAMFLVPPNRRLRPIRAILLTLAALVALWPAIWILIYHNPFT
jgi:hypothetical protein